MISDKRQIVACGNFDVIVVGGGIAGVSAAVASARKDMKVLLIEKGVNLGGLATSGLISWYEPLCDGNGTQVIGGIAEELIKLSGKYGFDNLPKQWGGTEFNRKHTDRYSTYYSPTIFTLALDEYVETAGVKLRFDTYAVYPVVDDGICNGVICESINGREFFGAKVVIDATGDASVADRAGIPTVVGENYMTYISHYFTKEIADTYSENGDICKFRRWKLCGSDLWGNGHPENLRKLTGVTTEDITDYVIAGKRAMLEFVKQHDRNEIDIVALPTMAQFRTIRRIVGEADFNAIDGEKFADSIGCCSDFRNLKGHKFQIPYRALYNKRVKNLLAAGRIISAPQGDGWEVSRVIPVCAMTGQVAGLAAAVAVKNDCTIDKIDINILQNMLIDDGVKIHY